MNIIKTAEEFLIRFDGKTFDTGNEVINKQRKLALRTATGIITVGAALNLAGVTGTDDFRIPNIVFITITLLIYILVSKKTITLRCGLYMTFMVALADLSGEMLHLGILNDRETIYYILADCILYAALMTMTIITYMPWTTATGFFMGGICYATACAYSGSEKLTDIFIILLLLNITTVTFSFYLKRNIRKMMEETQRLKEEEKTMLDFFKMDKDQLLSYIRLANRKGLSTHETNLLLNSFSEEAKQGIIDNIATIIHQREARVESLRAVLPELSTSEIEIAALIVSGKKLKDICLQLQKSESNITCQRSNIRKKLGLRPGDDLYTALTQRART
ncbi:MAG: LuxR C-terminal-related transcriptional regulator [Prevotella sp.]|nr:LuxR C-terminal-related transcriptional regulator [Prevotella sp.]